MSRTDENDFEEISEWLRSERQPFSEQDRAAMRRAVWRKIEAHQRPERGSVFRPARILFGGTALLAAVLVAVVWLRPIAIAPAGPALATVVQGPTAGPVTVQHPPIEAPLGPPAIGQSRPNLRTRRTEPEGVPVRIEFQTANPEVRIIWLVKNGEAAPPPFSPGRHQEVS